MKLKLGLVLLVVMLNTYYGFTQASASKLLVSKSSDAILSSKLKAAFDALAVNAQHIIKNTGIPTFKKEDFDFGNFYISFVQGEPGKSIVAPYKGNVGNLEFSFVITEDGTTYSSPILVKSMKDRSNISFYDLSDGAALSINKMGSSFTYQKSTIQINNIAPRVGCGQAVMNCVMDVYSNHGWVSVWATLQSIFVPATGAAIIAACIARNCIRRS